MVALPDYQACMLPLLQITADSLEHTSSEVDDKLASHFGLTDEQRNELLPSGTQSAFYNRVRWAGTYLRKALLLKSTGKGRFQITQRGLDVVKSEPQMITRKYLLKFPEFVEFQRRSGASVGSASDNGTDDPTQTP